MGRHRKRGAASLRTGLLGFSAVVAIGVVAVTTGAIPADSLHFTSGDDSGQVRAERTPSEPRTQTGPSAPPWEQGVESQSPSPSRTASPSESAPSAKPSDKPKPSPSKETAEPEKSESPEPKPLTSAPVTPRPTTPTPTPTPTKPEPDRPPTGSSAETQVINLVNEERANAGCSPLKPDAELAALAENFSEDMAARGFFDHTDPDGDSPWDRAEQAGITDMGGENIARGQADAEAVMESWMNSPGHRANILNCEFSTIGVGAHFADGGPWWTQDFGY
ncbi:CAP domain-containing protein [Streptomyces sp. NA04227]|uniref:CAP domain-containing protein n=1 Tax=Streptomyces sp. NA04227 TaxID=2742136 RepID=UPI001592AEFE|nr:CAP domain-containing protein [Streptomyces sp. NA04227]QKW09437.1 CAP domain-containing protein [Streptomyces sp. NA04227]